MLRLARHGNLKSFHSCMLDSASTRSILERCRESGLVRRPTSRPPPGFPDVMRPGMFPKKQLTDNH
jgi:hypothetical protein